MIKKIDFIRYAMICLSIGFFSTQSIAQQVVSGTVTATNTGEKLPGATVTIKGTTNGTITDIDGKFSLTEVSNDDVLIFSFIGFVSKEITPQGRTTLNISLEEDISQLGEVIVLGYTETTKKSLSASVVSIDEKELQNVTSPNLETMLQGKVAGVSVSSSSGAPGAAADIRIRGITSLNSDIPPLIVVDGIIGGSYVPNDVETVTVLKDAAAIGLYGAAGAAGVIIITTKIGKGEPTVSFTATVGMKEAITGNFEMMDGAELYQAQKKMWGPDNLASFLNNRPEYLEDRTFDWLDVAFNPALVQNYNLAMTGKSNDVAYGFSIDYFNEEGTFIKTDYERLNLRGNLKFNIGERFRVQTDVNAQINQENFNHYSWFEDAYWNMPWDNPYAEDGSLLGPGYVTDPSNEWYGQFRRSFLYSAEYDELGYGGNNVAWSTVLSFQLTDWLSLESRTRLSGYNGKSTVYHSPKTDFGLPFNGTITENQQNGVGVLSTQFLRFSKTFNKHDLGGFVAFEGGYSRTESLSFDGQNMSSQSIKVPAGASVRDGSGTTFESKGLSYIADVNYGYDGKYFATGYFRRDGSSVFAENNQYGNFYGGSFAWLLSEESFLAGNSSIDLFKLRLSYGLTGNSNIPAFLSLPTYNITRQYNGLPGGDPDNPANPNLGWETTKMLNFGIDIGLENGFSASVDAYQKQVEGMLLNNPLPFSSGYESRTENIGDMRNRGIELGLNYNHKFGDFGYSANLNFAYNKNKITKITDAIDEQPILAGGIQQINVVGEEAFQWYMPRWLGVDSQTGGPIWETVAFDAEGNVASRGTTNIYTEATFQPIESALPEISGGFSNNLTYKNFSLNFLFTFQMGNHIYHQTRFSVDSDGANTGINLMRPMDDWVRWEKPGDIATHPEYKRGGNMSAHQHSSRYIEKGDYLRLRNVRLSYTIPKGVLDRLKMKGATISLMGDNLFTWTNFSGMDPDIGYDVEAYALPGVSSLKYPISRQYLLSLNINF